LLDGTRRVSLDASVNLLLESADVKFDSQQTTGMHHESTIGLYMRDVSGTVG